jgi:hypothetical protein
MHTQGDFGKLCDQVRRFRGDIVPLDITIAANLPRTAHVATIAVQEVLTPDQAPRTVIAYDVQTFITTETGVMQDFVRRRLWETRHEPDEDGYVKTELVGTRVNEKPDPNSSGRTTVWRGEEPESLGEGAETLCIYLLNAMDMVEFMQDQAVTTLE